jgi:hypothetical protein
MKRHLGLVDICIAVIVAVAILLPARKIHAVSAHRGGNEAQLAAAEAATLARPEDGAAAAEFSRLLAEAGHSDWAVLAPSRMARSRAPTAWRALMATSLAFVDRLEPEPGLAWARRAMDLCHQVGKGACPEWEEIRMDLYARHLDAGVRSGINPKRDPEGFRRAGEQGSRPVVRIEGSN